MEQFANIVAPASCDFHVLPTVEETLSALRPRSATSGVISPRSSATLSGRSMMPVLITAADGQYLAPSRLQDVKMRILCSMFSLFWGVLLLAPFTPAQTVNLIPPSVVSVDHGVRSTTPSSLPAGATTNINFSSTPDGLTAGKGLVATDLSGNGNDCTFASPPPWLSGGGVQMGSVQTGASASCVFRASTSLADNTLMNARTIIACVYLPPFFGRTNFAFPSYATLLGGNKRADLGALWFADQANPRASYYPGIYFLNSQEGTTANQPTIGYHCITYVFGSIIDSTLTHIYLDGIEYGSYNQQLGKEWDYRAVGDYWTLGALPWQRGNWLPGNIYWLTAYAIPLSSSSVLQANRALIQRAFEARGLDLSKPSRGVTSANEFVVQGDSLTNGTPRDVPPWPSTLSTIVPFSTTNIGTSGTTCLAHLSSNLLTLLPLYSPNSPYSYYTDACGINDLNVGGESAESTLSYKIASLNQAKAIGFTPIVTTMLDSKGQSAHVEAINIALRNFAVRNDLPIMDFANEPCLGASGAYADPGSLPCGQPATGGVVFIANCAQTKNTVSFTTRANSSGGPFAAGDHIWLSGLTGNCSVLNSKSNYSIVLAGATSTEFKMTRAVSAVIASSPTDGGAYTIFQADGLHPYTGEAEMASVASNVLNYLTGSTKVNPTVISAVSATLLPENRYSLYRGSSAGMITLPTCYGFGPTEPFTVVNATAAEMLRVAAPAGFKLNGSTAAFSVASGYGTVRFFANVVSNTESGCGWFTRPHTDAY